VTSTCRHQLEVAVDNGILAIPGNQPDIAPLKGAIDHHEDMVGIADRGLGQAECLRPDAVGHVSGHKGARPQLHRVVGRANPGEHLDTTPLGGHARADPVDVAGQTYSAPPTLQLTSTLRPSSGSASVAMRPYCALVRVKAGFERGVVIDRGNHFIGVDRPAGFDAFIGNDAVKGSNQRGLSSLRWASRIFHSSREALASCWARCASVMRMLLRRWLRPARAGTRSGAGHRPACRSTCLSSASDRARSRSIAASSSWAWAACKLLAFGGERASISEIAARVDARLARASTSAPS
jgi:hypothetical protein